MHKVLHLQNLSENPEVTNCVDTGCQETTNKAESKSEQKYKTLISMANVLVQSVNADVDSFMLTMNGKECLDIPMPTLTTSIFQR
jgi:hypothetical protein